MINDKINEDSSSEGTLKTDANQISVADPESSKKSDTNGEKKLSKGDNVSVKSITSSISLEEASSKKQRVRSADDMASSGGTRKKKTLDKKLLKYYPNVPGETINNY